jgi:hypothetical protein
MQRLPGKPFGVLTLAAMLLALSLGPRWSGQASAQSGSVVVIRQFGAALRNAPSSDASIVFTASCGDVLPVIDSTSGWYEVLSGGSAVWVGGARVVPLSSRPSYSCADARTFQIGDEAVTYVPTGCLSLRYTPSRDASYDSCVNNGHVYVIENGPIEVNGEDWFEVWSRSTGDGWSLAQYLYTGP